MPVSSLDPTAGERARRMRLHPEAAPRVTDPTDPRFGRPPRAVGEVGAIMPRIVDPTDPECGRRLD